MAERFAGPRSALIGDAAVGIHPVTAHGFNVGLQSQKRLADTLLKAWQAGQDIGAPDVLQGYARAQQRASWPLYQATSLLVRLCTPMTAALPACCARLACAWRSTCRRSRRPWPGT